MFLFYSLSAQFVLVEGFKKLKLKDARVQKPFKAHIGHLKMVRHRTETAAERLQERGNSAD
jgi:hypothetical protein